MNYRQFRRPTRRQAALLSIAAILGFMNRIADHRPGNGRGRLIYDLRGTSYFEMGNYEAALIDFDHAIEINPSYARASYWRHGAIAYRALERFEKASNDELKAMEFEREERR